MTTTPGCAYGHETRELIAGISAHLTGMEARLSSVIVEQGRGRDERMIRAGERRGRSRTIAIATFVLLVAGTAWGVFQYVVPALTQSVPAYAHPATQTYPYHSPDVVTNKD